MINPEERFMREALEAAAISARNGDYAHGAVIIKNGEIIAVGYETLKSANDPVNGHAEIDAIRKACQQLNQPYLQDCVMYCTAEPCPMCMSAIIWAKMPAVVHAITRDDMIAEMERLKLQSGGKFSWRQIDIPAQYIIDHGEPKVEIISGFMREEGLKLFALTGK